MPPGTQVQHWTKELSAAATNMDPAVMNLNLSPLQSSNALPATTLLVDPKGGPTIYSIAANDIGLRAAKVGDPIFAQPSSAATVGDSWPRLRPGMTERAKILLRELSGGSVYGNEHTLADRFMIRQSEDQIRAANPGAAPGEVDVEAGRQARWIMTGEPGPSPLLQQPGMAASTRWLGAGAGVLNFAGGAFMLASVDPENNPALVTLGKVTSGGASVVGGGVGVTGALLGDAGLIGGGAALSEVGFFIAAPIMIYEMRPRGIVAIDPELQDRAIQRYRNGENVDAFCAQCHSPGGALDPNNDWNAGGARRAAFVRRLQFVDLGR